MFYDWGFAFFVFFAFSRGFPPPHHTHRPTTNPHNRPSPASLYGTLSLYRLSLQTLSTEPHSYIRLSVWRLPFQRLSLRIRSIDSLYSSTQALHKRLSLLTLSVIQIIPIVFFLSERTLQTYSCYRDFLSSPQRLYIKRRSERARERLWAIRIQASQIEST